MGRILRFIVIHLLIFFTIVIAFLLTSNTTTSMYFRATLGDTESQNDLGDYLYKQGQQDLAEKWFKRSAEGGNAKGYISYADVVMFRNKEDATEIYKKGVEHGCIECGYELAKKYADIHTEGVKSDPAESSVWAEKTFLLEAHNEKEKQLKSEAMYWCGSINYRYADRDESKYLAKAKSCFERVTSTPNKWAKYYAEYNLALIYLYGGNGVKPEKEKGAQYFINYVNNISNEKYPDYTKILQAVKVLFNGIGVEKDIKRAKELAKKYHYSYILDFPAMPGYELYRCEWSHPFNGGIEIVEVRKENNELSVIEREEEKKEIVKKQKLTQEEWNKVKENVEKIKLFSLYDKDVQGCLSEGAGLGLAAMREGELQVVSYTCGYERLIEPVCKTIFDLAGLNYNSN